MRRLAHFIGLIAFLVLAILVAESLTSEDGYAQRYHADMDFDVAPKVSPNTARVVRLIPAPIYASWWREIAQCESLPIRPPIDSIRFYAVNAAEFQATIDGKVLTVLAVARPDDNEMYLVVSLIADEALLKHEMLHFLLAWSGYRFKNFHPVEFFETCGVHRTGP